MKQMLHDTSGMAALRKTHLAVIQRRFPHIASEQIRLLNGNDHFVYVLDQNIVMRFPQTSRFIDPHRKLALDDLAATGSVPFDLPLFDIAVDEESGLWYELGRFLPGVALSPGLVRVMDESALLNIARQMGVFLTALHSMPLPRARSIGMNDMDPTDFWAYIEQNPAAWPAVRDRLLPHLPEQDRRWVESLFARFIVQTKATLLPLVVRHSDMRLYHIIVDPETHALSGVIDFAWRIADPAGDFKAFEFYGKRFVDEVYAHYALTVDPDFDNRRLFYTGYDLVHDAMLAIDINNEAAIADRLSSLSGYIAAHP